MKKLGQAEKGLLEITSICITKEEGAKLLDYSTLNELTYRVGIQHYPVNEPIILQNIEKFKHEDMCDVARRMIKEDRRFILAGDSSKLNAFVRTKIEKITLS